MITQYVHDSRTGTLVYQCTGNKLPELRLYRQNARGMKRKCVTTKVREGGDAFNTMARCFGKSCNWPDGWWQTIMAVPS